MFHHTSTPHQAQVSALVLVTPYLGHILGLSSRVLASQTNEEAPSRPSLKLKPRVRDAHKRDVLHCLAPLFLGGLSASFCLNPAIIPSYGKRGQGRTRITENGGMGDPCICILETMAGGLWKNKGSRKKG